MSNRQTEPPNQSSLSFLCSRCRTGPFTFENFRQAIQEDYEESTTIQGHCYVTTWGQISQSIRDDSCSWCTIIRRTRDGLPTDRFPSVNEDDVGVTVKFQILKKMGWNRSDSDFWYLQIYLNGFKEATYLAYEGDGANKLWPRASQETPYVNYLKISECIKVCETHERCPPIEEAYLPTRVIDCSDPSKPRLIETHRQIKGLYCALSYVWGGEQYQKTTTSNINTYVREGINVVLPQTISDAILVTNKLGIRYLWVDALCIIQDSSEDKDNELGIMARIYRDAYLTISALSAFRADHGFLPDERAPDVLPFYFADPSRSPGWMILKYIIPRFLPGSDIHVDIMPNPLDGRAWCLQESKLSPRRLIFQPPYLSYKCPSFNELDISQPPPLYARDAGAPSDDHIFFHANTNTPTEDFRKELREQWQRILMDYCERKITVSSDKLVALASIAETFQPLLDDCYIAGLWRKEFFDNLFWAVCPPMGPDGNHLPRPSGYRAPTWSWASVDGKLLTPSSRVPSSKTYEAEIVSCEAIPKISNYPFGEIKEAKLTLRAKAHPLMRDGQKCTFMEHKATSSTKGRRARGSTGRIWIPPPGNCFAPLAAAGDSDESKKEMEIAMSVRSMLFDCLEGTEQDRQKDFYVVVLRAGKGLGGHMGDWMQGFLLLRVEGEVELYRRVAQFNFQGYNVQWSKRYESASKYDLPWPDWFDAMPLKTLTLV
ncbi:HET-domain-containing protein [Pholiota conissans]|uniref:HET-domain-containing protein n=1 Tax=Pholiota conissans TaxID=109636 RepID=A0A9P6CU38_9AGAR|nr:HET-domain-containing protein [Pholiota conissans]